MLAISKTTQEQLIKTLSALISSVDSERITKDNKLANTVRNGNLLVKKLNRIK